MIIIYILSFGRSKCIFNYLIITNYSFQAFISIFLIIQIIITTLNTSNIVINYLYLFNPV